MKIIIVDDSSVFRDCLKDFFEKKSGYDVVGEYEDGSQLLENINMISSELILMDINMPIMDGIITTENLLWKHRDLKIIAVTCYHTTTFLTDLICAGFKACIFKDKIYDELEKTIQKVLQGKIHFPEDIVLHPL